MLPHILHSVPRAAAVVQNQTQALRNVLQLQSSGPSSGSGSSWGNGPGPGGSKFNTGSRFHAGYNSAGRAVTQANAVTSHDGNYSQTDDVEDHTPRRPVRATPQKRHRMRSSSVSLNVAGRSERGEKMGVLQSVQLHARARHAFTVETMASAKERLLADPIPNIEASSNPPLLVRRNSTSAPLSPLLTPTDGRLPTPPPEFLNKEEGINTSAKEEQVVNVDPSAPQTVTPPPSPKVDVFIKRLTDVTITRNAEFTAEIIRTMIHARQGSLTAEHFNAALSALIACRTPGQPLNAVIRLYNDMLEQSVVPNVQTYERLIQALTTRDWEIHRAIISLETRLKQIALPTREEVVTLDADKARVQRLKEEDNFASAISLFEGILAIGGRDQLELATFNRLLRSCSFHSAITTAIHVFAQLESAKDLQHNHAVYQNMILTFSNAGRVQDAEEVFKAFQAAAAEGRLGRFTGPTAQADRQRHIQVWNAMIEAYFRADMADKAIGLVDQMLSSAAGNAFRIDQVPVTTSSTFSTVISGFILSGDIKSALAWFDKLLGQEQAPINPFQGLHGNAMRPDSVAWHMMLDALAKHGQVEDLNRLYIHLKKTHEEDHIVVRPVDHLIVTYANLENLKNLDRSQAFETLDFLTENVVLTGSKSAVAAGSERWQMLEDVCRAYAKLGEYVTPCNLLSDHVAKRLEHPARTAMLELELQTLVLEFAEAIYSSLEQQQPASLPLPAALMLARMIDVLGLKPELKFAPYFVQAYSSARYEGSVPYDELIETDWDILLRYATHVERNAAAATGDGHVEGLPEASRVTSVLQDIASHGITFDIFEADIKTEVLELLEAQYGEQGSLEFLTKLGPSYVEAAQQTQSLRYFALENALTQPSEPLLQAAPDMQLSTGEYSNLTINPYLTRSIEQMLPKIEGRSQKKIMTAYSVFEKNLRLGKVPEIKTISLLIQVLGRANELDKVRQLYTVAQEVIAMSPKTTQHSDWCAVEDNMIIALAHAGYPEAAHVHRLRILDQGGAPSADAYGVLIQHVKDTTDDTTGGMALFQEALERGITPNMYLYNNIISKLSKARKADYALELFQQMKASGITPSSITYGAVIGACARVGDVRSAEVLFQEMVHSNKFKPRVPPYNTMMQLHTTTKPSRRSVLYYFDELKKAGVKPSAHTYKLLIDAYGSLEPVDLKSMELVFRELQDNTDVELTGHHFASLINAYGCVAKDFDKAISVFNSMSSVPRAPTPDAVVFEAVINVIVAHKRTDLLPVYISEMSARGVHMTAYIANFLIKGYANVGDMEQARGIFETLLDPPTGVAAPNNHAPHNPSDSPEVPIMEPVYREPSTWEAMVRAELGSGNRDAALDLLERLKARQYPEAVYNRISGVLTDHTAVVV